jgi:hypothetical protein
VNIIKYIAIVIAVMVSNPVWAQVLLPNGQTTTAGMVALPFWWGQDNDYSSGRVTGSSQWSASGAYNIYIYTGNSPHNWLWGEVPLPSTIVPSTVVQAKCTASISSSYSGTIPTPYAYGYGEPDWPFVSLVQIDGIEHMNGQVYVNLFVRATESLLPWSIYIIDLSCPPVPGPDSTHD